MHRICTTNSVNEEVHSGVFFLLMTYTYKYPGLHVSDVHQIGAYSKVDRDPRGRTITVAYLAIIDEPVQVTGQDDAANAEWFPLSALPELAFDHAEIMRDASKTYMCKKNAFLKLVI